MAAALSALTMHGRALDVLRQDVWQLRVRIDQIQEESAARHAELMAAIRTLANGGASPA
jgi:hypothetical protein